MNTNDIINNKTLIMKQNFIQEATNWFNHLPTLEQSKIGHNHFSWNFKATNHEQLISMWIQEVVMKWWEKLSVEKLDEFMEGYGFPSRSSAITYEEIATIYLQENKESETEQEKWVRFGSDWLSANLDASLKKELSLEERQAIIVSTMKEKGWDIAYDLAIDENKEVSNVSEKYTCK